MTFLLCPLTTNPPINPIEERNIEEKEHYDAERIPYSMTGNKIVQDIVGRTISAHQEHVVAVQVNIDDIRYSAERQDDCTTDTQIPLFHAFHSGKQNIQ